MDDQLNYFNYFTEIEERFLRRRGGGLLLTTLNWALIETWKDAGIPLEAALRGIDAAFDRYDQRPTKTKKINSLAYCSQEVLAAAEDMKEATVGAASGEQPPSKAGAGQGFEPGTIAGFLRRNAELLESAKLPSRGGIAVQAVADDSARTLRKLAADIEQKNAASKLEDLERHLTVLEEKLSAALAADADEESMLAIRREMDRSMAPYRRKMTAEQIAQLERQYLQKRLFEYFEVPRLSLFYLT